MKESGSIGNNSPEQGTDSEQEQLTYHSKVLDSTKMPKDENFDKIKNNLEGFKVKKLGEEYYIRHENNDAFYQLLNDMEYKADVNPEEMLLIHGWRGWHLPTLCMDESILLNLIDSGFKASGVVIGLTQQDSIAIASLEQQQEKMNETMKNMFEGFEVAEGGHFIESGYFIKASNTGAFDKLMFDLQNKASIDVTELTILEDLCNGDRSVFINEKIANTLIEKGFKTSHNITIGQKSIQPRPLSHSVGEEQGSQIQRLQQQEKNTKAGFSGPK